MCDLTNGLQLCSCNAEQLPHEEIDWILQRKDNSLMPRNLRGKAAVPKFSEQELSQKEQILALLNNNNCFDFDYQPHEGDFLRLRLNSEKWAAFRFQNQVWKNDRSTVLDGWRSQMVDLDRGKFGE